MPSLYRGFDQVMASTRQENIFRHSPRTPRDTCMEMHNHADAWFFQEFGIKARSTTLICSTDFSQAGSYGAAYRITPSEPSVFIYSPLVRDFLDYKIYLERPSQAQAWAWLKSMQFIAVNKVGDIKSGFLGEVMVCCESFTAVR